MGGRTCHVPADFLCTVDPIKPRLCPSGTDLYPVRGTNTMRLPPIFERGLFANDSG